MKKEYVVQSIRSDNNENIIILLSPLNLAEHSSTMALQKQNKPLDVKFINFNDVEKHFYDTVLKNTKTDTSDIIKMKVKIHEYHDMNIFVGDQIFLEMTKAEIMGV